MVHQAIVFGAVSHFDVFGITCKHTYTYEACILEIQALLKGAVRWYCFDAKPFNLTSCFITKCDVKC